MRGWHFTSRGGQWNRFCSRGTQADPGVGLPAPALVCQPQRWSVNPSVWSVNPGAAGAVRVDSGDSRMSKGPLFRPRRPIVEELEARILYSADFAPQAFDSAAPPAVEQRVLDAEGDFALPSGGELQQAQRRELVFIDPATPDYLTLLDGLRAAGSGERQLDLVVLDAHQDGITQIAAALSATRDVSAVHILSHGSDGSVGLGSGRLDFDALVANAGAIQGWARALAPGADLLIYGCDVAGSEAGRSLMQALARLTGADVSASDDRTGGAAHGGDWDLEFETGPIETQIAVDAALRVRWQGVLPAPVNTLPTAQTAAEDGALAISGLSVSDVDADLSAVALSVSNGTLDVSLAGGALISAGANGSVALTLSGSEAQVNAALATLTYRGSAQFSGSDVLGVASSDATSLSDVDTLAVTVTAVNDAPVNTLPATRTANVDQQVVFLPSQVGVADADAGAGQLQVTLTATDGVMSLGGTPGLAFLAGDGSNDAAMTFRGTLTRINGALNNMRFRPDPGFAGVATLTLTTSDLGNTGAGGALADTDVVLITVGAPASVPTPVEQDDTDATLALLEEQQRAGTQPMPVRAVEEAGLRFEAVAVTSVASADERSHAALTATPAASVDEALAAVALPAPLADWTPRISAQLVHIASAWPSRTQASAPEPFADLWLELPAPALAPVAGLVSGPAPTQLPAGDPTEESAAELIKELTYAMGLALSVGAVLWANRAGLLTSVLLSAPAWHGVDPLPAIAATEGGTPTPTGEQDAVEATAESMVFQLGKDATRGATR